jgi:thioredoxin 1
MSEKILAISDHTFDQEVLHSSVPVLIDFWAEWCGPCRMLAPILEDLAGEYAADRLKIVKLDIEHNRATAQKYHVQSIPTLLLCKAGKISVLQTGRASKEELMRLLNEQL